MSATYPKITAIGLWLDKAPSKLKELLAATAGTSSCMFRQWVAGRRSLSADMAGRIADATAAIYEQDNSAPTPILRGELCQACRVCPHFIDDMEREGVVDLIDLGSDVK